MINSKVLEYFYFNNNNGGTHRDELIERLKKSSVDGTNDVADTLENSGDTIVENMLTGNYADAIDCIYIDIDKGKVLPNGDGIGSLCWVADKYALLDMVAIIEQMFSAASENEKELAIINGGF